MGLESLHPESDHERLLRDAEAVKSPEPSWSTPADVMEMDATLEALELTEGQRVLELGPGRGRFTRRLQDLATTVVGVDISLESLKVAHLHVDPERVALVHADATAPVGAPAAFDRILGTLASNLPDRVSRITSYRVASRALKDDGKFVFSTHYYGIRARLDREPKEGRYVAGGIYRSLLTRAEVIEEIKPFFARVTVRPICVVLPLTARLGLPLPALDKIARRVPLLRAFGTLLLVEAEAPVR